MFSRYKYYSNINCLVSDIKFIVKYFNLENEILYIWK